MSPLPRTRSSDRRCRPCPARGLSVIPEPDVEALAGVRRGAIKRLQLEKDAAIHHAGTMTVELQMLALSTALGLGQIVLSAHATSLRYGYRWAANARDEAMPPLTGVPARLERALRNFMETFPLFAAAIL